MSGKRKSNVFIVSHGVFLPIHIVWDKSCLLYLYLRIVNAFTCVSSSDGIHLSVLSEYLSALLDTEGMDGYILRLKSYYLING